MNLKTSYLFVEDGTYQAGIRCIGPYKNFLNLWGGATLLRLFECLFLTAALCMRVHAKQIRAILTLHLSFQRCCFFSLKICVLQSVELTQMFLQSNIALAYVLQRLG